MRSAWSSAAAIDDNSATLIEFANGGIGVVDVSFVHRSGPNPFELFGTEGSLTIGAGPLALTTTKLSEEEAPSLAMER